MKKTGLLDLLAEQHRTFISNLRLLPELKWAALGDLYRMENKEQYPLKGMGRSRIVPVGLRGAL